MITDHQRFEFMQALAKSARDEHGLQLSEWENHYVTSFRQSSRPTLWFTLGRRQATDRLWMKYGAELNMPHPLDRVTERPKLADADAGGCEYVIKDEGRQRRCNDPATCQEAGKLRYCQKHGEAVEKDCKRAKISCRLIKFVSPHPSPLPSAEREEIKS